MTDRFDLIHAGYTRSMGSSAEALAALRRYWGYDSFRPLQERIVASLSGGHDTCVVMPTGGGKSLCYQLPAAMQPDRTVIVVSPLIALMHDQVAQLAQMGIPAGMLNSSQENSEQFKSMRSAVEGRYRLLYLSPERLARADTIEWLRRVPVALFAIDEAHCISEWGHEFRPEYRQLSSLRQHFPDRPIAAFTASATRRVRHDIIDQLRLRNPHKYIASFHRANLRYFVKQCPGDYSQSRLLIKALNTYRGGSVIVYAPTIKKVEQTVDFLEQQGIPALAYHGQMDNQTRSRNQERWTSDEVPVLVGTIAFGLGINKAAVRAVLHLSMPKSIEQYYQEAGRAGRDGQPSDCVLLWQKRDVGLLTYFIEQMADPAEKQRSWQRYHEIRRFVESSGCRHHQVCLHFGETPKWNSCGACDVCTSVPDWLAEEIEAPRRRRKELLGPALARSSRSSVAQNSPGEIDPELRDYLRQWRRATAEQQGIPAFTVMHDTSLDQLCRVRPSSLAELRNIYGFGERKSERYGREILNALKQFSEGARARRKTESRIPPREETIQLLKQGHSFEQIAQIRGRQLDTVVELIAAMVESGEVEFQPAWVEPPKYTMIDAACALHGTQRFKTLKENLPEEITYAEIRLVVAQVRRMQAQQITAN